MHCYERVKLSCLSSISARDITRPPFTQKSRQVAEESTKIQIVDRLRFQLPVQMHVAYLHLCTPPSALVTSRTHYASCHRILQLSQENQTITKRRFEMSILSATVHAALRPNPFFTIVLRVRRDI